MDNTDPLNNLMAAIYFMVGAIILAGYLVPIGNRLERIEKRWDAQKVEEPSRLDALEQRVKDLEEKR